MAKREKKPTGGPMYSKDPIWGDLADLAYGAASAAPPLDQRPSPRRNMGSPLPQYRLKTKRRKGGMD